MGSGHYAPVSRSIATVVTRVVRGLVWPLSVRQRKRVTARVIDNLVRDDLAVVTTSRGTLRLLQLRSAFTASAAERFLTDEPETLTWINGFRAGDVLWDIGASLGLYSLYAALDPRIAVYAFEPSGFNFGILVEHIALNGMGERIHPLCVALGAEDGLGALFMSQTSPGHGGNVLNRTENQYGRFDPVFRQTVPAWSIDGFRAQYALPAPTHLKIDVDGIEDEIVQGARDTLPAVASCLIEVQGRLEGEGERRIEAALAAAGLHEEPAARRLGSGRNRIYHRR